MKARIDLLWFDAWVGLYIDNAKKILYLNPFPFVVFSFARSNYTFIGGKWVDRDRDEETRYLYGHKYSHLDKGHTFVAFLGLYFFAILYGMIIAWQSTFMLICGLVFLGGATIASRVMLDTCEDITGVTTE